MSWRKSPKSKNVVPRIEQPDKLFCMATFDSTETALSKLNLKIVQGRIQLLDFQRGWV